MKSLIDRTRIRAALGSHAVSSAAQGQRRFGFSLLEVVLSTILVGTLLVAATRSLGSSVLSQRKVADRAKAAWLADALLYELHRQPYQEPGSSTSNIARESGESATSRVAWDDVDDYHGWSDSPPQNKDGTVLPDLTGWQRTVTVQWVPLANIASPSAVETGVKLVTVTAKLNGTTILTRVFIRTRGT